MMFGYDKIEEVFGVRAIKSHAMNTALTRWDNISSGKPPWANEDDDIRTRNMAKFVSDTRAKLTTLDIGIAISCANAAKAEYLQKICDKLIESLPEKVCDADRLGGILIKWNGVSWDFILPNSFCITSTDANNNITGAIFAIQSQQGEGSYTRLEWHRFVDSENHEGKVYAVTNKAFKNRSSGDKITLGDPVPLASVKEWADISDEVFIEKLENPLFGYYRVPGSNVIDGSSPLGCAIFADAIEELKSVDVAISRKDAEIEDSKHITFVGQVLVRNATQNGMNLPRFVKGLGIGTDDGNVSAIHEHTPTLLTESRIKDINFDLSMLGVKCGFSEGVFVLDGQTGMITATQVEADDRDTIQTIKNDRDALQAAVLQAIKGADALGTLMNAVPPGDFDVEFSFGDITYSYEEDKANWKSYAQQGWVPVWLYLVKFEKMSEEEAKKLCEEMNKQKESKGLFE